jgi:hypothetical protein
MEWMDEDRHPKVALLYHPTGRNNTGRPVKSGNETGPGREVLTPTGKRNTAISSNNINDSFPCPFLLPLSQSLLPE